MKLELEVRSKIISKKMQKILILNNEDLFKLLEQAKVYLPSCEILHNEPIDKAAIVIGNIPDLQKLSQGHLHLIGLVDNNAQFPTGITIIKKPYHLKELIEVIQNISSNIQSSSIVQKIGNFAFDPAARNLLKGQIEISLTEKESQLIILLNNADGEVVSREDILKEVWGYDKGVDTHTVETHIYRIRQKIGKENDFIGNSITGYFIK